MRVTFNPTPGQWFVAGGLSGALAVGVVVIIWAHLTALPPVDPDIEAKADSLPILAEQLETAQGQVRELQALSQSQVAAVLEADQRAKTAESRVARIVPEASVRAAAAGEALAATLDSLRVSVPPEALPLVNAVGEQAEERDTQRLIVQAELEARDVVRLEQIDTRDDMIERLTRLGVAQETRSITAERALAIEHDQRVYYQSRASPGFVDRIKQRADEYGIVAGVTTLIILFIR